MKGTTTMLKGAAVKPGARMASRFALAAGTMGVCVLVGLQAYLGRFVGASAG
jgi:hypothetical protein